MTNAVEAIDESGTVRIQTDTEGDQVRIRISDTGRGMTTGQLEHLFDAGFTSKQARVRFRVGLPAAAATVRKHGGRIDVQSHQAGGTIFTVRLPVGS